MDSWEIISYGLTLFIVGLLVGLDIGSRHENH